MQKWLDNTGILIYFAHNEGKSVITEMFMKTLKAKTYKTMTANDSKSYSSYLNKLAEQYNNIHLDSIGEKLINADYSTLTEKIETNPKAPKFKVNHRVTITKYKNIFGKGYTDNRSRKIFIIDSVLKANPWTYKIEDLNGDKKIGQKRPVAEKIINELLSRTRQSY